jgi:hypothetical protein
MARTVTFSDHRVAGFVRENFAAVWETAAEVNTATYDLGEGEEVKATVGGEIALYFCRPDGKVFDILPALQSPKVTLAAMKRAAAFYRETGATDAAISAYHHGALVSLLKEQGSPDPEEGAKMWERAATERMARPELPRPAPRDPEPGTAALRDITAKAVVAPPSGPPITIMQPRGLDAFRAELHAALSASPPKDPAGWKKYIFEGLLGQSLEGGKAVRFDVESGEGSLAITR